MEQFEYKIVFYEHGFAMRDLNNEGKNGWEICDIERLCGAREYVIFKRKKVSNNEREELKEVISKACDIAHKRLDEPTVNDSDRIVCKLFDIIYLAL